MEKAERNYSLDFLKFIAAIGIVFHHFQATTYARYEGFINFHGEWFNWGYLVELFFILSGYFMYRYIPVIKEGGMSLFSWWKKRALRLLPMSAISVIAFELILFAHNTTFDSNLWGMEVSVWGTVIATLGVQEGWVFENPIINNSVWYISVLMACYIIFYIVTVLSQRLKCNSLYFYVAIILIGIGVGVFELNLPFLNWQMARGYYAFFFGLLLAAYVNKYGIRRREIIFSLLTLTVFTLIFIFYHQYAEDYTNYIVTFIVFPAIVMLFETKAMKSLFRHKLWGVLGGISFEVYLWHLPLMLLMYFLMKLGNWSLNFENILSMFAFSGVTLVFATLMYFGVEKPISKLISKKTAKNTETFEISEATEKAEPTE